MKKIGQALISTWTFLLGIYWSNLFSWLFPGKIRPFSLIIVPMMVIACYYLLYYWRSNRQTINSLETSKRETKSLANKLESKQKQLDKQIHLTERQTDTINRLTDLRENDKHEINRLTIDLAKSVSAPTVVTERPDNKTVSKNGLTYEV